MDRVVPRVDERRFQIQTYGCKVNTYDSGLLEKRFEARGYKPMSSAQDHPNSESSVFILNTCAVTEAATREAAKEARRIKSRHPFGLVVVTGCGAQVDTETFEKLSGVDLIVANSHKGQLEEIIEDYYKGKLPGKVFKSNIFKKEDLEAGGGLDSSHSRAFLKIQDGCNSFCTFCVIPFARGKSRSIPISVLVSRVNDLYAQGFREVVITGVHIGDYEDESFKGQAIGAAKNISGGARLEDLVETLLAKTVMPRFRISSLEPVELSDRLLQLYVENDRLCPHFHLSIQHVNSRVLAAMKRQYGSGEVLDCFARIQRALPGAYVGMDVIVGFPGETAEEFEEMFDALKESAWSRIHVFSYSKRPGTYAARLKDQVGEGDKKSRARRLRQLSQERIFERAPEHLGAVKLGLALRSDGGAGAVVREKVSKFLTRDYLTVLVKEPLESMGELPALGAGADGEFRLKIHGISPDRRPGLDPIFLGEIY